MKRKGTILFVSIVLSMVFCMSTTIFAAEASEKSIVIDIPVNLSSAALISDLSDSDIPSAVLNDLSNVRQLVINGEEIDLNNSGDIQPFAVPIPPIGGYYYVGEEFDYVFTNVALYDGPPAVVMPVAQASYGWLNFYYFNTNGNWCTLVGEPHIRYPINQHNPIIQKSTPAINFFQYQSGSTNLAFGRGQMIQETEQLLPSNTWYDNRYALLYEIRNGNQLIVNTMSSPTALSYGFLCNWDAIDYYYLVPTTTAQFNLRLTF